MLKTRLTLPPGARGTKKQVARYGERLVCVRYRYDEEARRRVKTVELIEEDVPWTPDSPLYLVQIRWEEEALRARIKAAGGQWDPERKLWKVTRQTMKALRLETRVRDWVEGDDE